MKKKYILTGFIITLLTVFLDLYTKHLAEKYLSYGVPVEVIPSFFNLLLHYNPGAAFGIFGGLEDPLRTIVLWSTTLLALGVSGYLVFFTLERSHFSAAAVSLILGGAIGNAVDRARYGYVFDFIDWYIKDYHWPTFNIADSAICLGVAILLFVPPRKNGKK